VSLLVDGSTTISSGTNDYYNIGLGGNVGDTNNSLTVTSAGTVANAANNILVGQNGLDNTMTVSSGASVVNLGSSVIGLNATASGNSVLVTGAGSTWSSGTALLIGSSGSGNSMSVEAGADVASAGSGVALGYNVGSSDNSLLIDGVGSTLADSADFVVGFSGSSNSVVVSNGGTLTNGQHSYGGVIGLNSGANNNSVLVSGSGSAWNNSGDLTIGNSGQGTLTVANGGSISANAVIIASQAGSSGSLNFGSSGGSDTAGNFLVPEIKFGLGTGTINFNQTDTVAVTVSGAGFINQSGSGTTVLTAGTNTLPSGVFLQTTINGGSLVASGVFSNALLNLSQGNFTLTGEGSTWSTSGTTPQSIWVGNSHPGNSAVISNGASMQAFLAIGQHPASANNSVVVTGAGSSWNAGNTGLNVGVNGSGNSMTISDGGNVSVAGGAIGLNSGANNNSVLVTGSGSAWILGNLTIGQAGGGNLTLANGGMATSTEITVASQSGSIGTLNIGRFGTNDAAGTINAPSITFGAGTGTINFNQSNATTISAVISGSGTVNQLGSGTTTLSANNTYAGTTTVTGGLLNVNGSVGSVTVSSGGSLGGSGTTGSLLVNGTLTPGNSPGTLNTGSQTWFNGANYNWQIFNATGSAGSGYDLLNISGSLDLSNLTAGGFGINMWSLSGINPDVNGNATNFNAANNYSWILAQAAAGITGFEATDFSIFTSAANGTAGFSNTLDGALSIAVDGNNLVLNYQAVPEPSTYTLLGLGVVGMLITLRRRARAKVG
jgi:T5SS/PEP-CTERM-associated repeat protein